MRTIRAIAFPIFNWGQAGVLLIFLSALGLIAINDDPLLALYMGIGGYAGIVVHVLARGLVPDEIEIREREVAPISAFLNSESLVEPIGNRIWAPCRYKSWLWASDRISIRQDESGRFRLYARRRDLKLILARIRPGRSVR